MVEAEIAFPEVDASWGTPAHLHQGLLLAFGHWPPPSAPTRVSTIVLLEGPAQIFSFRPATDSSPMPAVAELLPEQHHEEWIPRNPKLAVGCVEEVVLELPQMAREEKHSVDDHALFSHAVGRSMP